MASFDYPPLTPDPDPAPLSPSIPLNPPMVGEASPFEHVDGQNRDLILESIRAWIRTVLLRWTKAWQDYLVYWLALVAAWLNEFVTEADAYITEHAISGYSWRTTVTPINPTGTTAVTIVVSDPDHRPLAVGDLVSDQSPNTRYGIITALIDATHATVTPIGILQGFPGFGWWPTVTAITHSGTTAVVLIVDPTRAPQVNDLVLDNSASAAYGKVTIVTDATHVTVAFIATLQGPQGIQGDPGPQGDPGVVQSIVAGTNVAVDNTDPANPVVSASGGGGGGSTVFATQTLLFGGVTTEGDTYTVANAPGLTWTRGATSTDFEISGILQAVDSDDANALFDSTFYTSYFDGSGRALYTHHSYSGITYKLTDDNLATPNGTPWDSDWIGVVPNITAGGFVLGGGTINGMMKFSSGALCVRGVLAVGIDTVLGTDLAFQLAAGLVASGDDLPMGFTVLGDAVYKDDTETWRGYVENSGLGDSAVFYLVIPDVAGSGGFDGDVWAGRIETDVNHTWATDSQLEWVITVPMSPTLTTYDDGRSLGGDGGSPGDFPAGGRNGAGHHHGLTYPPNAVDTNNALLPDLTTNPNIQGWDISYGFPQAVPVIDPGGSGVSSVGAIFDDSTNRVSVDVDTTPSAGYTPVLGDRFRFYDLDVSIVGVSEDTDYWVIDPGTEPDHSFQISASDGGSPVTIVTGGNATLAILKNVAPGSFVYKATSLDPIGWIPIPSAGHYLPTTAEPIVGIWLNYS